MVVSVLEEESTASKKRSRFVQYSLRSMLVLMVVAGVGIGLFGSLIRVARERESAAEVMRQSEVDVRYVVKPQTKLLAATAWNRKYFGRQMFEQVSEIQTKEFEAAAIVNLVKLFPYLQRVFINNTYGNDETFRHLAKCPDLTVLYAGGTEVTNAGVMEICDLPSLEQLVLWDTRIGDEAIAAVSALPSLKALFVQDTDITDKAIRSLYDSALRTTLEELNVNGTAVTSESLTLVAEFESLRRLSLKEIPVRVEEASVLSKIPGLIRLEVSGLDVESLERLEMILPKCFVHCSDLVIANPAD